MSVEFHKAAGNNEYEKLMTLIKEGADVNSVNDYGGTPLMIASKRGHVETVRILLENGADPNIKMNPPRDPRQTGTALHTAAQEANNDIVLLLIEHGAEIDSVTGYGETPLISAAVYGNLSTAKILINHGADRTKKTLEGKTASQYALSKGHVFTWLALR